MYKNELLSIYRKEASKKAKENYSKEKAVKYFIKKTEVIKENSSL